MEGDDWNMIHKSDSMIVWAHSIKDILLIARWVKDKAWQWDTELIKF